MMLKTIILLLFMCGSLYSEMAHLNEITPIWHQETLRPFNELILTWNGKRPSRGTVHFYIRVKTEEWSSWLLYASWGHNEQRTFDETCSSGEVKTYQDAIEVLSGKKASAFEVKVVAGDGAILSDLHALHVYTNGDMLKEPRSSYPCDSVKVDVAGLSQIALEHARNLSLCSPTSTTAVIRYLALSSIDPVSFASHAHDQGFDIYGNWILNSAQASVELGSAWNCWVERLDGFNAIHNQLLQGFPVVISIRGPISGSAMPYEQGHLIAVIGYRPLDKKVICMDPAFPSDAETIVHYDLDELMQAWNRRGRVAYLFVSKKG